MPPVNPPSEQWFANKLAQMEADLRALKSGRTQYVVDPSTDKLQAIVGNVETDANGNGTGQEGWGVASFQALNNGWTAPTLAGSWVNFTGAASTPAGYLKDALGFVHLRGRITGGASGSTIFTLPPGFRPHEATGGDLYSIAGNNGGVALAAFLDIVTGGNVVVFTTGGTFTDIGLGGVTFLAES